MNQIKQIALMITMLVLTSIAQAEVIADSKEYKLVTITEGESFRLTGTKRAGCNGINPSFQMKYLAGDQTSHNKVIVPEIIWGPTTVIGCLDRRFYFYDYKSPWYNTQRAHTVHLLVPVNLILETK